MVFSIEVGNIFFTPQTHAIAYVTNTASFQTEKFSKKMLEKFPQLETLKPENLEDGTIIKIYATRYIFLIIHNNCQENISSIRQLKQMCIDLKITVLSIPLLQKTAKIITSPISQIFHDKIITVYMWKYKYANLNPFSSLLRKGKILSLCNNQFKIFT